MDRTLIVNAMVFDGSGAAPFSGDVLVEGQRIAAVQMGGGLPRGGARVIDGAGATLMPGLVEPHGHVSYADAVSTRSSRACRPRSTSSPPCAMPGPCSSAATRACCRAPRPSPGSTS